MKHNFTNLSNLKDKKTFRENLNEFLDKSAHEIAETKEAGSIINKYLHGHKLTVEEKKFIRTQTFDVLKSIGIIVPFTFIPGASILIPAIVVVAKKKGIEILPSSFNTPIETNEEKNRLNIKRQTMDRKTKYSLEDEISRTILSENGCTVHFEYADDTSEKGETPKRRVTAFTFNPKTQATFLLKEVVAQSDEEGLQEILNYVNRHKEDYLSFTVRWAKKGEREMRKSDFYCLDLLEALEKFYYNKKREDYIVYETKMNSVA